MAEQTDFTAIVVSGTASLSIVEAGSIAGSSLDISGSTVVDTLTVANGIIATGSSTFALIGLPVTTTGPNGVRAGYDGEIVIVRAANTVTLQVWASATTWTTFNGA